MRPLNTIEAADYLGLSKYTLEAWRCRGRGPRFVKLNKSVRYRQEDLDRFLAESTRESTSGEGAAA